MYARVFAIAGLLTAAYASRCGGDNTAISFMIGRAEDGMLVSYNDTCHRFEDLPSNHCDWGKWY